MKTATKSRRTKIIVDILMAIFLALSFVRWDNSNFPFHAIVGTACTVVFIVHICIHWKWLKAVTKSFLDKKMKNSLKGKYVINILLLIVWGLAISSGFLAVGYFSFGIAEMAGFARLHGVTSRMGLILVAIHVFQHIPQIKSYLGMKKSPAHRTPSQYPPTQHTQTQY